MPLPGPDGDTAPQIELTALPHYAWVLAVAKVPLLPLLRLQAGDRALGPSQVVLVVEPALGPSTAVVVPALGPGETFEVAPAPLQMPTEVLKVLKSSQSAAVVARWLGPDGVWAEARQPIELQPPDWWPGLQTPATALASLVQPQHPALAMWLRDAALLLTGPGHQQRFSGYAQRSRAAVGAQVAALWAELAQLRLERQQPPQDNPLLGQRFRTADQVLAQGGGSALDLALLLAAALERAGLRPLLVLSLRGVLAAVWCDEDRFPEGEMEDAARLRNQVALGQVLLLDAAQAGRGTGVEAAHVASLAHLDDGQFELALDIRVLRDAGYGPGPLQPLVDTESKTATGHLGGWPRPELLEKLHLSLLLPELPPLPAAPPPSRWQRWKDRLVDLTLRNKMLSFKPLARSALALQVPGLAAFEDLLAADQVFELLAAPPRLHPAPPDGTVIMRGAEDAQQVAQVADLHSGQLHTCLPAADLLERARELELQARRDLEESGAASLYAAVGLLRWTETATADQFHLAPLLLWPVALEVDRRRSRVRLRRLPEDPSPNAALIEKMRRDFQIDLAPLLTLEQDEAGLDVTRALTIVRQAVAHQPRWEVLDQAHLGTFSFSRFALWRDLEDNAEILLENPAVRMLAEGDPQFLQHNGRGPAPHELDDATTPFDLPGVVDADSTQQAAVAAVLAGRSFVLHGPPGTGKSQTITNLIAACLARGKTVLFVAEKMAALEVVQRRLEATGLGPWCLELHSHKANKKSVLSSFGRALDSTSLAVPQHWQRDGETAVRVRSELNAYARALHRPRPLGKSVWQAAERLQELQETAALPWSCESPSQWTADQWAQAEELLDQLALRVGRLGQVHDHALSDLHAGLADPQGFVKLLELLTHAEQAAQRLHAAQQALLELLQCPAPDEEAGWQALSEWLGAVAAEPLPAAIWQPSWAHEARRLTEHAAAWHSAREQRHNLSLRYDTLLYKLDISAMLLRLRRFRHSPGWWAWLMLWPVRRALAPVALTALGARSALAEDLQVAVHLSDAAQPLNNHREQALALTAPVPLPEDDVPRAVATLLAQADSTLSRADQLAAAAPDLTETLLSAGRQGRWLELAPSLRQTHTRLAQALDKWQHLYGQLASLLGWHAGAAPLSAQLWVEKLGRWQAAAAALRPWLAWQGDAQRARLAGLSGVVEALQSGPMPPGSLSAAAEKSFLEQWLRDTVAAEPALEAFEVSSQQRRLDRFAAVDLAMIDHTRVWLQGQLHARMPNSDDPLAAGPNKELALVQRERAKKMRHLPVRRLLESLPTLLPRLKPCLLMSPLSVAQFLRPDQRFDVVVFDEASQIGTHDAIGAIGRGRQVVVVGDTRQMPPTAFFQRQSGTEDLEPGAEDDVAELESVLDEAIAAQWPQQWLSWHYRSRHPSLIAFSNQHFYDQRLMVFAAAADRHPDLGVRWRHVEEGVYQSKTTGRLARTNPIEAQALVAYLVDALRRHPPGTRTFGIVTFSLSQQSLVQRLLDDVRVQAPEIDGHFSGPEPVFVKNLENVQGDERDEILFSIGYAKDAEGKLRMHFGPLSNAGGERRLNVAVTRARQSLVVFSALRWQDIELGRTQARGALLLREFLRYAEAGGQPQAVGGTATGDNVASEVATALRQAGYTVQAQVGAGQWRIDLAVRDPADPERFCLGILLDGPAYGQAATARDRDRLRPQVLASLGWKVHRLWSTAWRDDRQAELARLLSACA